MNDETHAVVMCPYCPQGTRVKSFKRIGNNTVTTESACSEKNCKGKQPTDEEKAIKAAIAAFTAKERIAYFILNQYAEALYDVGVEVNYFPEQAEIVTINAARDMAIAIENADDAIL